MTEDTLPKASSGRPTDEKKRKRILAATETLISRQGFYGTSIEAIAREAGVSKVTIYNRFGDLITLVEETAIAEMDMTQPVVQAILDSDEPLETRLIQVGRLLIAKEGQNRLRALERLVFDLSSTHREVSDRLFHTVLQPFADMIEVSIATDFPDTAREITWAYLALLRGGEQYAVSLGVASPMTPEEFDQHLRFAIKWALVDEPSET